MATNSLEKWFEKYGGGQSVQTKDVTGSGDALASWFNKYENYTPQQTPIGTPAPQNSAIPSPDGGGNSRISPTPGTVREPYDSTLRTQRAMTAIATPQEQIDALRVQMQAAKNASRSRTLSAEGRERQAAAVEDYQQRIAALEKTLYGEDYTAPTFGERAKNIFTGAAKQYGGTMADAPASIVESMGGTAATELYEDQLSDLLTRRAGLNAAMRADPAYARSAEAVGQLEQYNEQIKKLTRVVNANKQTGTAARAAAAELSQSGAADVERAQEGLGTVGRTLVQAGVAGVQMGADLAVGAATGGGSMLPMMIRSFGGGTQEAREKGYSQKQQLALGLTNAATEYFTEKMFGGNPVYDADAGLVNKLVGKIVKNETVLKALDSVPVEMLNEGLEEIIADILEPAAEWAITGTRPEYELDQIIQDGAVGVLMGMLGQGGQALARTAVRGFYTPAEYRELVRQGVYEDPEVMEQLAASSPEGRERHVQTLGQAGEKAAPGTGTGVNENGLISLTDHEKINLSSGSRNKVVSTFQEAVAFVRNALSNKQSTERAYLGKIPDITARKVLADTGIDIRGYNAILPSDAVRHMFKNHGDVNAEAVRGQVALTPEIAANLTTILSDPDKVRLSGKTDAYGRPTLIFEKQIGDYYITAQAVSHGTNSIQTDTLYIRKGKNSQDTEFNADGSIDPKQNARSEPSLSSSVNNIPQTAPAVKERYTGENGLPKPGGNYDEADWRELGREREAQRQEQERERAIQLYDDWARAARPETAAEATTPAPTASETAREGRDTTRAEDGVQRVSEGEAAGRESSQTVENLEAEKLNDQVDGGYRETGYRASPALRKLGVKIAEPITDTIGAEVLVNRAEKARTAKKRLDKALRDLRPSKAERSFAQGLADGTYTEGNRVLYGKDGAFLQNMDMSKVRKLADYYRENNEYKDDRIAARRRFNRDNEAEIAGELLETADSFKRLSALQLNLNTMKRNMLAWAGPEKGARINSRYFDPVEQNSAERIRFVNRMLDRMRDFHLSRAESEMVQRVIEGTAVQDQVSRLTEDARRRVNAAAESADFRLTAAEYNLNGEERKLAERYREWLQVKADIRTMDEGKIMSAAYAYSAAYDDFYKAINEFLVMHGYEPIGFIKGYAPHLQPENVQNTLGRVLSIFGLDAEVSALPTEIAGQTENFKPGKQWNPYFQHRAGADAQIDAVAGYESYVNYMSNVLYHTDDIQKLRVFANELRGKYASEEIRNNIEQAKWLAERTLDEKIDFLRINRIIDHNTQISPETANDMIEKYIDDQYSGIENKSKHGDMVSVIDDYTNKLAGKQTKLDRAVESFFGRRAINIGNRLSGIFGESAVVGNLSSALNQLSQLPMVQAEVGNKYVLRSLNDILHGVDPLLDQASDFLTGKMGTDSLLAERSWRDSTGKQRHAKITNTMSIPFEAVDNLASRLYVRAKYLQEMEHGATHAEAVRAADDFVEKVVGNRIQGSRPMIFESKNAFIKLLSTFQLEIANAWAHISQDLPADIRQTAATRGKYAAVRQTAGLFMKYSVEAFLINRLAETLYGGTPAPFDLLGYIVGGLSAGSGETVNEYLLRMIGKLLGLSEDDDDDREFDPGAALKETGSLMVGDMPYVRNAASLLGYGDSNLPLPQLPTETAASLWDRIRGEGSAGELGNAALKELTSWAPGGNQIKKIVQGIQTVVNQGRYNKSGNLMYPVDTGGVLGVLTAAKAILFGISSLDATDAYYAGDARALSAKQTEAYQELVGAGEDMDTVYDTVMAVRKVKNVSDTDEDAREKRNIIRKADISDLSKAALYSALIGDSRDEDFAAFMNAGLTWDDCMDVMDKYYEFYYFNEKQDVKASRFEQWVDGHFDSETAELVKDALKYWQMVPATASSYKIAQEAAVDINTAAAAQEMKNSAEDKRDLIKAIGTLDINEEQELALMVATGCLTDAAKDRYNQYCSWWMDVGDYAQRMASINDFHDIKDANGKTAVSKKDQVVEYINALPLLDDQKSALFVAAGYAKSGLDDCPWYHKWALRTPYFPEG